MKDKLIACDLGTGGIKASLFDVRGCSLAEIFQPYKTFYSHENRVEQRPEDWWKAVCSAVPRLLSESGCSPEEIACAALSGHSLVAVPLDEAGRSLQDQVPIWCDMRAGKQTRAYFQKIDYEDWYTTTGNGDPPETYTVFKLMWLKENEPEIYSAAKVILGSKDYINFRLTGSRCTDPSYASGFGVFDLKQWDYEPRFIDAAEIRRDLFPPIRPSDSVIGYVTETAAVECGLASGTPVACGAVDNTCMSLGATGLDEGRVYASLGSSSWIAVTSRKPIVDTVALPFVFAHVRKGYYTSAVSIFSAGNSFRWLRDTVYQDCCSTDAYENMNREAAASPVGSHGVLFNPTLAGGSSQEPSPRLKGGFMGLTLATSRGDLARSAMEGVAMALRKVLDILKTQTVLSGDMLLTGGCSKSALWRRIFCDIFAMPVLKTNVDQDTASLGAAALAANSVGLWDGYSLIPAIHRTEERLEPDPIAVRQYEKLLDIYGKWTGFLALLADQSCDE